jgi:hypothetical protein
LPGDSYLITAGLGDTPSLYSWDGFNWINITTTASLASDLAQHRANMFSDEIHLTDDQAGAVLGTYGSPSLTNRFVTDTDTRIPTQSENDALVGSEGSPSSTNKYVTEEYSVTAPSILIFGAPVGTTVVFTSVNGPFYVGKGGVGSANKYFSFLDLTSNIGYVNSSSIAPQVLGVFKDILLTLPLNPLSDADSSGYYSSNLFIFVDVAINTAFRAVYGKKSNLKTILRGFTVDPSPDFENIPSKVIELLANIKGYPFATSVPPDEQNINLALTQKSLKAYIGSVLQTNVIAADEDFTRLEADLSIGSYFDKNIGISEIYTFPNTGLTSISYSSTTGLVTYGASVNLSGVRVGDLWKDGAGADYLVSSVNDGLDQLGLVDIETGEIPTSISTSVGTAVDASTRVNFNPRNLLLSEMKFNFGSEIVPIRTLEKKSDEFELPSGNLAYGIKRHDGRFDPRVVLYGSWENHTTANGQKIVRNSGDVGSIELTGFFTDVSLLMHQKAGGPTLSVTVDKVTPASSIDTSASGLAASGLGTSEGFKFHPLVVASGLPSGRPNHVTISISASGTDSLDIFGLELINVASTALLESGVAFQNTAIVQRNSLDTSVPVSGLTSFQRGGSRLFTLADNSYGTTIEFLEDLDESSLPGGQIASATSVIITTGTGKLTNYNVGDVFQIISAGAVEVQQIASIVGNTINLVGTTSIGAATAVTVTHVASTDTTGPNPHQERLIANYDLFSDFNYNHTYDFGSTDVGTRFVLHRNKHTLISGQNIGVSTSGLIGATKAVTLDSADSATLSLSVLATRFDIVIVSDSAGQYDVSIDGCTPFSISFTGSSAQRKTIFSNARYQSHEVTITPTSGILAITEIFLFGPDRSINSSFTNETALLDLVAYYSPSSSLLAASPYTYPLGGVFFEATSHLRYLDGTGLNTDWFENIDFTKTKYGKLVLANNEDAAIEFSFLGSAFELQYLTGPDHGIFKVTVDGTPLQLAGGTVVGNYGGNEVDAYSASYGRANIGAQGLSLGYHTVKAAIQNPRTNNGLSTDYFMAFTGYYVENSTGNYSLSLNRDDVFTSFTDLRNFIPLEVTASATVAVESGSERSDIVDLPVSSTSASVVFTHPYPDDNYIVSPSFMNLADISPTFQSLLITAQISTGFTVKWNVALPTDNYKLAYITKPRSV